jgi:iron(II)-dependent oxidoreductase
VLRHLRKQRPLLENGDTLYNSSDVAHDTRWDLLLPTLPDTLRYLEAVLDQCTAFLDKSPHLSKEELYFYLLALFHETMHAEALAYTRQTLGYPAPGFLDSEPVIASAGGDCSGDVAIPGGKFLIGAAADYPFVFDNEKWAHEADIKPFRIARAPVTNGEYVAFVEDGGYRREHYWSAAGWRWRNSRGAPQPEQAFGAFFNTSANEAREIAASKEQPDHPVYWQRDGFGRWQQRIYDRLVPLREKLPAMHLSWYEAEAYCNWAGRRLPAEAEWEIAAAAEPASGRRNSRQQRRYYPWGEEPPSSQTANLDWHRGGPVEVGAYPEGDSAFGCRQLIGNVWEWTADDFKPYPGFTADPYKEYSKPWFGSHKVLRGGCWATSSLLIRNTWRNFYTPDRRDIWAGFRTCAR